MKLIQHIVPHDLGGDVQIDFHETGLDAILRIPAIHVTHREKRTELLFPASSQSGEVGDITGCQILLVEDEFLVALDVETRLTDAGAKNVMVASNCASATEILERLPIDLAVLDVNLGKETSIGIADELAEQEIPFVFATGYSDSIMIPDRHAVVPVIRKPCQSVDLVKALAHARELGQSTNQ